MAAEFGMGVATAEALLKRWVGDRRLDAGMFVEAEVASNQENAILEQPESSQQARIHSTSMWRCYAGCDKPRLPQPVVQWNP